ncbi:COBRA-like protein 1 [Diospyros lotus]|uniref:COBRA-like protein 1 n=1 Tax=Diospyros lotus TaxID=55363 RepID=UPI00225B9E25|nr:COBRA-like protein 1 [Diospyros lotus]
MGLVSIVICFALVVSFQSPTYGFDPLDPNGNITIRWDVLQVNDDTQDLLFCNHLFFVLIIRRCKILQVKVNIFNYQLFRHIEHPGWKLSWTWPGDEAIWNIVGAEATEQGDCSAFRGRQVPHCCEKKPVIIDLMPGAPFNKQVANCCKGGVLSSLTQRPDNFGAAFQMSVGSAAVHSGNVTMPVDFTLGLTGYSCGDPFKVPPSKFSEDNGRRRTQALATYNVICSYSQFRAATTPTCCVSLSAFYNESIVPCPMCSCGCQGLSGPKCVKPGDSPAVLQLPHEAPAPLVRCTRHMCPIRVHWHVKLNYREYWRVKITVTNLNYAQNYSQWNLVVLHPSLHTVSQVFSFNYKPLNQYGHINDTGMFYGIQYYNDMLLQAGDNGNVQTEMLLKKEGSNFTFQEGWAFPRKISFNGEDCVMPPPDNYPGVPSTAHLGAPPAAFSITCTSFMSLLLLLVAYVPN